MREEILTEEKLEEFCSYFSRELAKNEEMRDLEGIDSRINKILRTHKSLKLDKESQSWRNLEYALSLAEERLGVKQEEMEQLSRRLSEHYSH